MQRGSESEAGPWCPEPKHRPPAAHSPIPLTRISLRALRVSVHSSSKLARCRIRQLLLRISTDSPSISPTIPPCYSLRRQRSARGCSATRHWDLGPLQALASLQYRTKMEPCSKGRPRRAEPTLPRWSLLIKPRRSRAIESERATEQGGATKLCNTLTLFARALDRGRAA